VAESSPWVPCTVQAAERQGSAVGSLCGLASHSSCPECYHCAGCGKDSTCLTAAQRTADCTYQLVPTPACTYLLPDGEQVAPALWVWVTPTYTSPARIKARNALDSLRLSPVAAHTSCARHAQALKITCGIRQPENGNYGPCRR
jgi:hypothetical protein